ncbi:MAG: hypothetical protein GKR94_14175 [Gammaproteobacteria bacterium]|nr:hypothetical protein [Gammaproteobacteria bacterium]
MIVRLTSQQRGMLIEVKEHFKWQKRLDFEDQPTCVVLKDLDEDDAVDLRELCSDYLLEVGFDEEYNANIKGKSLEELIDKLYVE